MTEQRAEAFHDWQPEADSLAARAANLVVVIEDARMFLGGAADAVIGHLKPQLRCGPAAADDDATSLGVADGIGDQILQHALEQHRIALHPGGGAYRAQIESLLRGQ